MTSETVNTEHCVLHTSDTTFFLLLLLSLLLFHYYYCGARWGYIGAFTKVLTIYQIYNT
jgi:hypothetical protein